MPRELFRNIIDPPNLEKPDMSAPSSEARKEEFEHARFKLIQTAQLYWEKAVSYRDFKVGCAVLAWHPNEGWVVYGAHNFKPEKKEVRGEDKRCAERGALRMAEADGCTKIAAIVTVSDQRSTGDDEGTPHGVLHSCKDCLELFRELPSIDEQTIVYNVHDGDLKTDPAGNDIVFRGAIPGVSPILRKRHLAPPKTDFAVMGEERTMKELLSE